MNSDTLDKLKKNPHYKMSDKQRIAHAEAKRKEMTTFGSIHRHNQNVPINNITQEELETSKKRRLYGTQEE